MKYLKMKKKEIELKLILYTAILSAIKNKDSISALLGNLYQALKDAPQEELQEAFLHELAKLVHEEKK